MSAQGIVEWGIWGRWLFGEDGGDNVTAEVLRKYVRFHKERKHQAEQLELF